MTRDQLQNHQKNRLLQKIKRIKKKRKTIVITKNLKKKDGKGQDLDHTAQIGEEEVDQGQKTGGDESQGQGQGRGHMEGGHAPGIVIGHHQGELTLEEDQDHQEGEDLEVQEE